AEIAIETGERLQPDDQQRRPHRLLHRDLPQQHQRRNDQETTPDADQTREDADRQTLHHDQPERHPTAHAPTLHRLRRPAPTPEHEVRRQEHHDREEHELGRTAEEDRQAGAQVRPHHRDHTEDQRDTEIHVPRTPVTDRAEQTRRTDHRQTHRNGFLRPETQDIDENRDREDRASPTQQPQRQSDHERQSNAQPDQFPASSTPCPLLVTRAPVTLQHHIVIHVPGGVNPGAVARDAAGAPGSKWRISLYYQGGM